MWWVGAGKRAGVGCAVYTTTSIPFLLGKVSNAKTARVQLGRSGEPPFGGPGVQGR